MKILSGAVAFIAVCIVSVLAMRGTDPQEEEAMRQPALTQYCNLGESCWPDAQA
eukprot:CAMPEP_0172731744 /NCGR_PEP_ID=MMETSP1074-20121228/102318_1 /TAXON_ID=2916 /ORGANISM="Ceratium fusus, Strain PA161109" /LENGTH=53 /DNA_ID=CAMNT_0013559849 /DNA_START=24 /DNA_END=181 /DNA_ORIENTATION=+